MAATRGERITGPIAPPLGDVDALVAAAEMVAGGPGLRRKLGRAARERAMAFDVEAVADRCLELYGSPGVGHA